MATVPWVANNKGQHSRIHKKPSTQGCATIWISSNALAKGWVSGLSKLIGFISDGAPHAGQVIRGSQDGAWHQGMILLIVDTNGEKR